jgi:hypothetical protein
MGDGEMPAEKIQSTHARGAHVRVAWGKDYPEVQIASLFDSAEGADSILGIVNDWLKAAGLDEIPGREELDKLIDVKRGEGEYPHKIGFEGFHVLIADRSEVNRLIRAVKRARDDSMGKDE